jgi:antitoxin component YwqK of YwqJK toxin-antitoxin module
MTYKDGEKTGVWKQWNDNGELIKTTDYSSL